MPYEHDFTVLEASKYDPANYRSWPKENQFSIHAGVVEYMWDSLNWLPSDFAHNKSIGKTMGLDSSGICVLWSDGALILGKLCRLYASIFALGPDVITLTGGTFYEVDSEVDGFIPVSAFGKSTTQYDRDMIVSQLRELADMCNLVAEGNNTLYLGHCGL